MAYADQATLAALPAFQSKIQMAIITAAVSVVQESPPNGLQNEYLARRKFAIEILKNPSSLTVSASWALASFPSITMATLDGPLQTAVVTFLLSLVEY